MDPTHLMLNRSIFNLYPNLASKLTAQPLLPGALPWAHGFPQIPQTTAVPKIPARELKQEHDSCGGSSASNASDTNGSGDEVDVDTIDDSASEVTRVSANSLKFSIGNLLKDEAPKAPAKTTQFWSPVQQIHANFPSIFHHQRENSPHPHHLSSPNHNQHQHGLPACFQKIKQEESTQVQSDLANYSCDLCGKTFKHVRMLNRHRRNHSPFKKYKCNFCGKGFNDSFDLKRHVRTHTGVKPYKCTECDKSFTQRCSLESHQDKIHGIKPKLAYKQRRDKIYVCEECGFSTGDVREHYSHARECSHKLERKMSASSSSTSSIVDSPVSLPMKLASAF
ncbi:Oidioi.mRNA.OKI2018_I69.chr2.g4446.t1.cds [Oikopleura dioica]|uniref:Oidioi.mRNA.OKI2018_I69.chr2.g4446.t1.cds n=1 Tax=Oikopleura dioica TaxID=34765 RepID=A0ABN7T6G9_OIKDI|nr:Oidioi.mRNA.OKI2018_I69.chr2.g4446.t1.cds [Oikopleura dioica]